MRTWATVVRIAVVGVAILAGVTAGWSPASAGGIGTGTTDNVRDVADAGPHDRTGYHPAQLSISVTCESFNSWIWCTVYGADTATQPRTITWYINGVRFTPGDNTTSIRRTCLLGQSFRVRVVVVGGNGTAEATSIVGCVTGRP